MLKRLAILAALAALPLTATSCLVIGPCDQLCFLDPELFFLGFDEAGGGPRLPIPFDICEICVDGGCGGGDLACFRDGTTECGCFADGFDDPAGQSRLVAHPYEPPANVFFQLAHPYAGLSGRHVLQFDAAIDNLQTRRGVVTYPEEFAFAGFLALGPAGTQIGAYGLDIDKDGTPDAVFPVIGASDLQAYADVERDGVQDAIDPTIAYTIGSHVFTVTLPFGGDGVAARFLGPIPLRITVALYGGILVNPTSPGDYPVTGVFTSVDPDSGDADDMAGAAPQSISGGAADRLLDIDPSPLAMLDHYLCYKARPSKGGLCRTGSGANEGEVCGEEADCGGSDGVTDFCRKNKLAKGIGVALADKFSDVDFTLKKPTAACAPAEKNDEGAPLHETYLRQYTVKAVKKTCLFGTAAGRTCESPADCGGADCGRTPREPKRSLRVDNQLGVVLVETKKAESLLIPSMVDLATPPVPNGAFFVGHFKCYTVKETKKRCAEDRGRKCKRDADCGLDGPCVQKFPKGVQVALADELTPVKLFDVKKPKRLCLAADKNDEGVGEPEGHLMCYQVKRARGTPKHDKRAGLYLLNQLDRERLDTQSESELCIPSLVSDDVN